MAPIPAGELLHPASLAAIAVLAVNDHLLKGSGLLPAWLTGKLSDFAGLLFFPLLLTSAANTLVWAISRATRRPLDFALRRWKLAAAIALTAAFFIPLELSDTWARLFLRALGAVGVRWKTTPDPTDLLALIMLAPAWWIGVREIARAER